MNNLLFTALLLALLYYFFYYLPSQKKLTNRPLTHSQSTQTETIIRHEEPEKAVQFPSAQLVSDSETIQTLYTKSKQEIKLLHQQKEDSAKQIKALQTQIRDLAKRPLKPTNSKGTQTDSETELTQTLDTLIKNIQELNNEL